MTRRMTALVALSFLALAGCEGDGPNDPEIAERLVLTVNSTENSLSLVPVEGGAGVAARTVGLGAQGTPVGAAARGAWAVVPLGTYPFAAVVNLRAGALASTVALPASSGATGAAFVNDTLAVVANPALNSVTGVRVERGLAGATVNVGTYPQAIVADEDDDRVYVINGNLVGYVPAGPGSVTVLDDRLRVQRTIALTGVNSAAGAVAGNRLYVLHSGTFGGNNGSLSVVNLTTMAEEAHYTGFGDYPSSIAVAPNGEVYVGIYGTGVVVWNPTSRTFRVGLAQAITPGGSPIVSGLGFDHTGRWHSADAGTCMTPGKVNRAGANDAVDRAVTVGTCPFGITFADVPEAED